MVLPCETTSIFPARGNELIKLVTLKLTSFKLSPFGGLVSQPLRAERNASSPTSSLTLVLFKPDQSP